LVTAEGADRANEIGAAVLQSADNVCPGKDVDGQPTAATKLAAADSQLRQIDKKNVGKLKVASHAATGKCIWHFQAVHHESGIVRSLHLPHWFSAAGPAAAPDSKTGGVYVAFALPRE
jgi:hypothetical protein